ncbi:ABC transporter permease [Promicromonospora vindobonensis]|uniref:ABC transporter permease n=1 Tax=Promicromonospora vindobonensis TaxID=195748 RepID=A0ABW5VPS7_9MICO
MTAHAEALAVPFSRTLHAEWIKFRSLRSTWYTLACLGFAGLGITALGMGAIGVEYANLTAAERADWDPTNQSLTTYLVAQLIIGVLGILVVTSEYATGLIQTSLAATPRRHRLLAAKAVLLTGVAVVAGQALMFTSFFLGQAMLAAQGVPNASLGDPGVLSAVLGGGVYLTAIALLAVGLGTILRATAGAIVALVAIVFLVPGFAGLFPSWLAGILDFWPSQGAAAVLTTVPNPDYPAPWLNLGGMCLGVAAVLTVAFVLFRRRDV